MSSAEEWWWQDFEAAVHYFDTGMEMVRDKQYVDSSPTYEFLDDTLLYDNAVILISSEEE